VKALTSCGHLKSTKAARALGVRLSLGHPLTVELRHLLDQVVIVEQDRSIRADSEQVLVALDRDAGIAGCRGGLSLGHCRAFSVIGRTVSKAVGALSVAEPGCFTRAQSCCGSGLRYLPP
jgi:hypothetical protein